jgi:hypothetical protein
MAACRCPWQEALVTDATHAAGQVLDHVASRPDFQKHLPFEREDSRDR